MLPIADRSDHTRRGWKPFAPFSSRLPGGIETAFDWYYRCRYCQGDTPTWCEGEDQLDDHICMAYICGICAVVEPALHPVTQQEACTVHCPTCSAGIREG